MIWKCLHPSVLLKIWTEHSHAYANLCNMIFFPFLRLTRNTFSCSTRFSQSVCVCKTLFCILSDTFISFMVGVKKKSVVFFLSMNFRYVSECVCVCATNRTTVEHFFDCLLLWRNMRALGVHQILSKLWLQIFFSFVIWVSRMFCHMLGKLCFIYFFDVISYWKCFLHVGKDDVRIKFLWGIGNHFLAKLFLIQEKQNAFLFSYKLYMTCYLFVSRFVLVSYTMRGCSSSNNNRKNTT